jgi:hypothetical protein
MTTADSATYTRQAVMVLGRAAHREHDFAGWLAAVLAQVAANLGGSAELTAGRPGSWEADLVDRLVKGTVGPDDEGLPEPDRPPGDAPAGPDPVRVARGLESFAREHPEADPVHAARATLAQPAGAAAYYVARWSLINRLVLDAAELGDTVVDLGPLPLVMASHNDLLYVGTRNSAGWLDVGHELLARLVLDLERSSS